jgi:hypothetical protein
MAQESKCCYPLLKNHTMKISEFLRNRRPFFTNGLYESNKPRTAIMIFTKYYTEEFNENLSSHVNFHFDRTILTTRSA